MFATEISELTYRALILILVLSGPPIIISKNKKLTCREFCSCVIISSKPQDRANDNDGYHQPDHNVKRPATQPQPVNKF